MTFYVLDATRYFRIFIKGFLGKEPRWDAASLERFGWEPGMPAAALSHWMLIRLIARRTEVVGQLIYYPFIIWFIMFLSRLNYFDNWHTPVGLAVVIFMCLLFAWFCAFMLRRSAESLRTDFLTRLESQLMVTRSAELLGQNKSGKTHTEFIQKVIEEIKAIRQGAFASFLQQPTLQALLVPFGGFSTVKLFEFLFQFT